MNRRGLILLLCLMLPAWQGCKESYPTGTADESIAAICEKEYGVKVKVKSTGRTVEALIIMPQMLQSDLSLSEKALDKLENVMLTTSRITLSSEFKYDFFVVTILDTNSGAAVSFVRYVKDMRRLIMDDISRSDYFQRLKIEVRLWDGSNFRDLFHPEYQLKDFLAEQMAERVRTELQSNLVAERLFKISGVRGEYQPVTTATGSRYSGEFVIRLFFYPDALAFAEMGTPLWRDNLLKLILEKVKFVVRRYEFKDFSGLRIVDQNGQTLVFYDQKDFAQNSMNTLMELIQKIKSKDK